MFKFLFGKKTVEAKIETQRETFERALGEVNDILAAMADKPKVALDLSALKHRISHTEDFEGFD